MANIFQKGIDLIRGKSGPGKALKDFMLGKGEEFKQYQRLKPEQQAQFEEQMTKILGVLQGGQTPQYQAPNGQDIPIKGDLGQDFAQFDFAPIAERAQQQFGKKTLPQILERFGSGQGSGGGSGIRNVLAEAAESLNLGLAAQEAPYNLQRAQQQIQRELGHRGLDVRAGGINRAMGLQGALQQFQSDLSGRGQQINLLGLLSGLASPENVLTPGTQGFAKSALTAAAPAIGYAAGGPVAALLASLFGAGMSGSEPSFGQSLATRGAGGAQGAGQYSFLQPKLG